MRELAVDSQLPTLEFRVPISPTDNDMRMVRYLLESIQLFGGPIAKAAHMVLSVGSEQAPFDLREQYPWVAEHAISVRWVEHKHFERWRYDATGYDRMWVNSDADVVALIDADLLVTGDFDQYVLESHREQRMLGFMAHLSPFSVRDFRHTPSAEWWHRIFTEAKLQTPELVWQLSGWGLDWKQHFPGAKVVTKDPDHKYSPPYFNYGVVVGPREFWDRMGQTFVDDLETVCRVHDTQYRSQIANCVGFERHNIPCGLLPIDCNFPLNLPCGVMRELNPSPEGTNAPESIKIFHYIGGRKHFSEPQAVANLISMPKQEPEWRFFQARLADVQSRIEKADSVRHSSP